MYRCQKCNVVVGPYKSLHRVVVETRPKTYPVFRRAKGRKKKKRKEELEATGVAHGHEIVKELHLCDECAETTAAATVAPPTIAKPIIEESTTPMLG
jgi:hypothetical protein